MKKRLYDNEEIFRVLTLILKKNKIREITQEAFEKCLFFVKKDIEKKYNVDCTFIGDNKFSEFTDYTKSRFHLFNDDKLAFIKEIKNKNLEEGIYNRELIEAAESEECLSVFGLSKSFAFNYRNFSNEISDKGKAEVQDFFGDSYFEHSDEFDF